MSEQPRLTCAVLVFGWPGKADGSVGVASPVGSRWNAR